MACFPFVELQHVPSQMGLSSHTSSLPASYLKHVCFPNAKLVLQACSAFLLLSVIPSSPLYSISSSPLQGPTPSPTCSSPFPTPSSNPQCFIPTSQLACAASQLTPSNLICILLQKKTLLNSAHMVFPGRVCFPRFKSWQI